MLPLTVLQICVTSVSVFRFNKKHDILDGLSAMWYLMVGVCIHSHVWIMTASLHMWSSVLTCYRPCCASTWWGLIISLGPVPIDKQSTCVFYWKNNIKCFTMMGRACLAKFSWQGAYCRTFVTWSVGINDFPLEVYHFMFVKISVYTLHPV